MIPILTYHQIAEPPPRPAPHRSLCVPPKQFARQMHALKRLGYQGLGMAGLLPYLQGRKQGKVVGITLDDGYLNNLEHAAPVLQTLGFSSTCYLVSQRMGRTNDWDAEHGVRQVPLMDASQARTWLAAGQEIGAHSRNHVWLTKASDEVAKEEIQSCRTDLEDAVGVPVAHFCYPYGDFGQRELDLVAEAGYLTATSTERGRVASAGADLLALPRVPVVRSTPLPGFLIKVATGYEDRGR
jgi:peptidoglycan/xylan/chitin deacetylase (PgdA/CDA1 family)